jgi:hypothetical protein
MFRKCALPGMALGATALLALQNPAGAPATANRIDLGRLSNGATVTFLRAGAGEKYGDDSQHLDVARVLHGTKAMLALPGRTYDLLGPGWQQEHRRMGPGARGIGTHRTWLPWISVNHLHGITGLEEFDKALYRRLATEN